MSIPNIARIAEISHARGALLGVDSTFASPVLIRPLELGADICMHSATKYLGDTAIACPVFGRSR